jgi:hypothetical protein
VVTGFTIWSNADDAMPPSPEWATGFLLLNWAVGLCLLLSVFAIVAGVRIWQRNDLRMITRVKFTLVGASCAFLAWFAIHWRLLGPVTRI